MTSIFAGTELGIRDDPSVPVREPAPGAGPPDDKGAGLDLSIFGEIALHLRSLADSADRQDKERQERLARLPIFKSLAASGRFPSSGNLGLVFNEKPDLGRMWIVRGISIGGVTWGTTAAGSAELYVTGQPGAVVAVNRDLTTLADEAPSLPAVNTYSSTQIVVNGGAYLVVVIVGGSSGQNYAARVQIEDHPESQRIFD
jgi:hypothetical protein